ncbi:DUF6096 family protein [Levilactobacillus bambusae]|uniref:Uncharacterized protein n=1 Tax=Levilactobacillus bambusae TaxID=2024736 RepID=A0A2V1N545_9LACO|nr:DUF6096 family protein [Levilactobacillus bambusae]PWG00955.1 hypothetical protein DCM90_01905 [Levilactobacillus bambusae]
MTSKKTAGMKFQFGKHELELRLDGKAILNIEKRLKKSIMSLFMSGNGQIQLPPTNEILVVLQGANQTHGVTDTMLVDDFQAWLDEGNTTLELFTTLTDLVTEAGFFGKKSSDDQKEEPVTLDNDDPDEDSLI